MVHCFNGLTFRKSPRSIINLSGNFLISNSWWDSTQKDGNIALSFYCKLILTLCNWSIWCTSVVAVAVERFITVCYPFYNCKVRRICSTLYTENLAKLMLNFLHTYRYIWISPFWQYAVSLTLHTVAAQALEAVNLIAVNSTDSFLEILCLLEVGAECGTKVAIGRTNNKHCWSHDLNSFTMNRLNKSNYQHRLG